ncbi:SHOCT domain-containing protein [Arthrobacter sp. HLT1-21]
MGGFMDDGMMGGSMLGGGMFGAAVIWSIVVVLLLAVTATAVVLIARASGAGHRANRPATAQQTGDILRTRYANGEIHVEEYRRRIATINTPT